MPDNLAGAARFCFGRRVSTRRITLVLVCVAVTGLILIILIAGATRSSTITLSDGRVVALKRLTYGRTDRLGTGATAKRLLGPLLPPKLARELGMTVFYAAATNDALFAWIELSNVRSPAGHHQLSISDDAGLESARCHPIRSIASTNGTVLLGFTLNNFPRHSERVTLHLYEVQGLDVARLARVARRNPASRGSQPWAGAALPVTVRDGNEAITLLAVRSGLSATGHMTARGSAWTELLFRIGTNEPGRLGTNAGGVPAGEWTIKTVTCRDANGNLIRAAPPQGRIADQNAKQYVSRLDDGVALVEGSLWPGSAWKIQAEFQRTRGADLPAEAQALFENVPLPGAGTTNRLALTNAIGNSKVILRSIAALALPAENTNVLAQTRLPVLVEAEIATPDWRNELRFIRATDSLGTNALRLGGLPHKPLQFRFATMKGATSANIALGLSRIHTAEFLVHPTVLRTNVAHWTASH